MSNADKSPKELQAEIDELRYRLEEAEETLRAIGSGEVDAFVVSGPDGEQVFSLKGAEQPYRALVETMNEGAATLSADGIILYCNNRLADLLQFPMEKLLGTEFSAHVRTADQHLFTALLKASIVKNATDEIVLSTATGGIVPVIFSCCAHDFDENKGISVVVTDLSQQKRNEKMLASERLANLIIEQAGEVIIVCDEQGKIIRASQCAYTLLGVNPLLKSFDEILKLNLYETKSIFSIIAPLSGEYLASIEVEFKRSDNKIYQFLLNAAPLNNDQNRIIGCFISLADITERKQGEIALRESEEYLRFFFEYAPAALAMFDSHMNYLYVSQRWRSDYGLDNSNLIERSHYDIFPEISEQWNDAHQRGIAGEVIRKDNDRFERADGTVQWVSWEIRPWYKVDGTVGGIVIFTEDITDRKQAEEEKQTFELQMQHTQKLESLGVLSGGIAHDFNNILAIIMGYCSLTKMDYETAKNNILEIEKAAERAAGLCRQMLAYAGKAQLTKTQVNMRMLVDEMASMLKSTIPLNAVIKSDLSTDIPFLDADASQLRQIVMNLIINASEAIGKEQGEIKVSLANATVIAEQSDKDYNGNTIPPGEFVCLEVTDNGCGMDEETKWRIFEPFYTTKFTGRGLGMSAVLGIIKSHSGALQLHSQLGQGTTFKVYLPVPKKYSAEDGDHRQLIPSTPWKGSGTILLVEDEDQVRLIAKALLKNIGFTVLEAVNGKEALELYQKNATDITLVITDMGMPIMDGYELLFELKKLNPELPIIVSSGYGDAEVGSRIGIANIAGIISKPYGPDQLREVLKKVLESIQ